MRKKSVLMITVAMLALLVALPIVSSCAQPGQPSETVQLQIRANPLGTGMYAYAFALSDHIFNGL